MKFKMPTILDDIQNEQLEKLIYDFRARLTIEIININADDREDFNAQIEETFKVAKINIKQMNFEPK